MRFVFLFQLPVAASRGNPCSGTRLPLHVPGSIALSGGTGMRPRIRFSIKVPCMDPPVAPAPRRRWSRRAMDWLRAVPIDDPVERNQAAMLQLLLGFLGLYQPLVLLDALWRSRVPESIAVAPAIASTVAMWGCFALLRRGHLRLSAGVFMAVSLALVGHGYLRWGMQAQVWAQLGQLLPVLVAGLLLSRSALWLGVAGLAVLMLAGAWRDAGAFLFDPWMIGQVRDRALHAVIMLVAIAAVLDMAVAGLRASLDALRQRNRELARARDRLQLEILEKERAREQLLHAQKMEVAGRLASGLAHDFNHLLGLVMGYAAQGPALDDVAALRKVLAGAGSAARRAADVSRRLLDFSRHEPPRLEIFDLAAALATMQPLLRQACHPGVRLDLELPASPQPVCMDRAQLELVMLNLAANAVQAMEGDGLLRITLRPAGSGMLELAVADNGPGMPDGVRAHCFEPFYTTKPAGQGTGLGLAVAASMVAASGGTLSVDDVPGPGCTMRIRIPRAVGAAPAGADSVRQDGPA